MGSEAVILVVVLSACLVSSIAGYGGSLVLVPALAAVMEPKVGIAFAALILGWNNVFKVVAYRRTLALREGWPLLIVTLAGVFVGTRLLIVAPDNLVIGLIIGVTASALLIDVVAGERVRRAQRHAAAPTMAAASLLSGVSGSSGPLKGVAVRSLQLPRLEHVGLASAISLVGDALKVELFHEAGLLADVNMTVLAVALPMMPLGAWLGRTINERIDEQAFRWVFWTVVGGYTLRMVGVWF